MEKNEKIVITLQEVKYEIYAKDSCEIFNVVGTH